MATSESPVSFKTFDASFKNILGDAVGMHVVDKHTGKGLREFLLLKGSECGMRKLECKSVSFHDTTPAMRGGFRNVLLGHYGCGTGSDRVDCYEVDLYVSSPSFYFPFRLDLVES